MKHPSRTAVRRAVAETLEGRCLLAAHVWLEVIDAAASEGAGDTATIRLHRDGSTASSLSVVLLDPKSTAEIAWPNYPYTEAHPADVTVQNYNQQGQRTVIPAGQSSVDLVITPLADQVAEGPEKLVFEIFPDHQTPVTYTFDAGQYEVTLADAGGPQYVSVATVDDESDETGTNPAMLKFTRDGDLSQWATAHTQLSNYNKHLAGFAYEVVFAPGQTEQLMFLSPASDDVIDPARTATVKVVAANAVIPTGRTSASFQVLDGPIMAPMQLPATADAWVGAGSEAGTNYGGSTELLVRDAASGGRRDVLLKFDISSIAADAEVTGVHLQLYATWLGNPNDVGRFEAYGMEDAVWNESGVTWSNRPTEPLSSNNGYGSVGNHFGPNHKISIWVTKFVQQQWLLGKSEVTILLTEAPPLEGWPDVDASATFGSRESALPPQLFVRTATSGSQTIINPAHRKLTIIEGGSVPLLVTHRDGAALHRVFKVPGGDPDINVDQDTYTSSVYRSNYRTLTFKATPDTDGVNGVARFVIYTAATVSQVITVAESDTGINSPPADPNVVVVPVTADGFAQSGSSLAGGVSTELKVDLVGEQETFLHFDLTNIPNADQIGTAKVVLRGTADGAATGTFVANGVTGNAAVSLFGAIKSDWYWDEYNLQWSNRPVAATTAVDTRSVGGIDDYEFDVGALLRERKAAGEQMVTLALKGTVGAAPVTFSSIEGGATPKLVVTRGTPPVTPPPVPPASPPPPTSGLKVNFQPATAPAVAGYLVDAGQAFASRNGQSYGWTASQSAVVDRDAIGDQLRDTNVAVDKSTRWELTVPNGTYTVTVGVGDSAASSRNNVWVEGKNLFDYVSLPAGQFGTRSITIPVSDGRLTIGIGSAASGLVKLNFVEVASPSSPPPAVPPAVPPTVPPTVPPPPPGSLKISYQPSNAPAAGDGYIADGGQVFGDRGNGQSYGWTTDHTDAAVDRNLHVDQAIDTNIGVKASAKWELAVPNGQYTVTISVGDAGAASRNNIWLEGTNNLFAYVNLAANQFLARTTTVSVTDGRLTIGVGGVATGQTRINYLHVAGLSTPPPTIPPPAVPPTSPPPPATWGVNVNFQPAAAPTVSGYLVDAGQTYAARNGKTYGWTTAQTATVDRNAIADQLRDTNVAVSQGARWELAVPNGTYTVTVGVGDAAASSTNNVWVEGQNLFNYLALGANQFSTKSITVPVSDGKLTIGIGSAASGLVKLDFIEVI